MVHSKVNRIYNKNACYLLRTKIKAEIRNDLTCILSKAVPRSRYILEKRCVASAFARSGKPEGLGTVKQVLVSTSTCEFNQYQSVL
jgi:hypothetical protein